MSKPAFTPGPWEFLEEGRSESEENANRPLTICDAHNYDDLAQVFSTDDSSIKVPRKEAIANATLIAAAPEMFEALRSVQKLITEAALTGFNWKDGDWPQKLFESQQQTSAALLKAVPSTGDGGEP